MSNPFASESSAFHFLVLTVVGFGLVVAASALGGPVAALVAWIVVSAAAVVLYARRRRERPAPQAVAHVGDPEERRVVVVAPLEASPLHRLANDVDPEQARARQRADAVAHALEAPHLRVVSAVGDDPVTAVDDALRTFGGDEIVVLRGDDSLAGHLRERYAVPVAERD